MTKRSYENIIFPLLITVPVAIVFYFLAFFAIIIAGVEIVDCSVYLSRDYWLCNAGIMYSVLWVSVLSVFVVTFLMFHKLFKGKNNKK